MKYKCIQGLIYFDMQPTHPIEAVERLNEQDNEIANLNDEIAELTYQLKEVDTWKPKSE